MSGKIGPKITRRTALAGLTSLAFAGESLPRPAVAQSGPIRVGWIVALTGFSATTSQAQDWGFRRTIDDINGQGGVGGRKLEIVTRDSASDPTKALSFAKELIFNEKVDVLCGPSNSGEVLPTSFVAAQNNKLQFVIGAVDNLIDAVARPLEFRCTNQNSQWIKVAVNSMLDDMKCKRIAVINDATAYGTMARDVVMSQLNARGVKPVYVSFAYVNKSDLTD